MKLDVRLWEETKRNEKEQGGKVMSGPWGIIMHPESHWLSNKTTRAGTANLPLCFWSGLSRDSQNNRGCCISALVFFHNWKARPPLLLKIPHASGTILSGFEMNWPGSVLHEDWLPPYPKVLPKLPGEKKQSIRNRKVYEPRQRQSQEGSPNSGAMMTPTTWS